MKKLILVWGFFIVTAVSLAAQNIIDDRVKSAVDNLANLLPRQRDVQIGEITIDRTNDISTQLSGILYHKVKHYAEQTSLFKVVAITRGPKRDELAAGTISGKYSIVGDTVEVYLNLTIDGQSHSQLAKIPVAELNRLNIAYLPDNFKTVQEAVKQENEIIAILPKADNPGNTAQNAASTANQTVQDIHIETWFDSELGNRLFMHREELKITVMADRDCYFKVIHIDVNSKMKMIYPNERDTNNRLRANVTRTIFETARYMFYGPYGSETLLIVASTEQFKDIEKEYIAPWTDVTAETVGRAFRGVRGGDLEGSARPANSVGEGTVRYSIAILKPDEEYEYTKPDNMTEMYQALRDDTGKSGGLFDGNETSGCYIVNGIRGSYRVPRDSPGTIQFVTYYLDNYTGGPNAGVRTRGGNFNFSFARPGNISQAVREVKNGIEGKGGTFTGNEREGNFRVKGIVGEYRITDVVNVIITDKPFVVSNSVIEKEVKNYFGMR